MLPNYERASHADSAKVSHAQNLFFPDKTKALAPRVG